VVTFERQVALSLKDHLKAKGALSRVDGGPASCVDSATVKIQKKSGAGWATVETMETNVKSTFAVSIPDKKGTYRVLAPRSKIGDTKICAKAVSPTKSHSH
jgi:hypothetical protein